MSSNWELSGGVIPPHCEPVLKYWQRQCVALTTGDVKQQVINQIELVFELWEFNITPEDTQRILTELDVWCDVKWIQQIMRHQSQTLRNFLNNLDDV